MPKFRNMDFFRVYLVFKGVKMKRKIFTLVIFTFILAVVGCASSVERMNDVDTYRYDGQKFNKVKLTISKNATEDLDDIVRFDQDELRNMIEQNLEVKELVDANSHNIVKVEITDIRVRSTFNAFMWGIMAGDDHIEGDISLLGENAAPFHTFHVAASYALGGMMGFKETRMGWLYEEFSKLTLQEILGEKP